MAVNPNSAPATHGSSPVLVSTWTFAYKLSIPLPAVETAARNGSLHATQSGLSFLIEPTNPLVIEWVNSHYPEAYWTMKTGDFIARFTFLEQVAIASNPAALVLWLTVLSYNKIILTDQRVKSGFDQIVKMGIITAEEESRVLAQPVITWP